ncbi:A-kinase anchor protein 4 [Alligator mississippiensis]|uniref:A-kinase anchor protein 4 n=1 Tax=Alligator mississippiensis TaxID=8496 RepID=A0A151M6A1_ALLMI|nr:A-kinase anchor protein 4 [Alligator mississippiensis]KYO20042.1 A-kinase anchor protein 4 [Alligator mississippiensis]
MSQEVDWLRSQAGLCKVDLYNPEAQKDQDHKVLCFVDVSSLNVKDKDPKAKKAASQSSNLSERSNEFDLEEKEVIVVKDNLKHDHSKTEGTVCLFKQGSSDEFSVIRWLNNDLQKYAAGFQHALTSSDNPPKHKGSNTSINPSLSKKMAQNSDTSLKSLGAQKGNRYPEDISCYINKLCSLVVQMARKEITDKLEGTASKCMQQAIQDSPGEGKTSNPHSSGNNPASEMVNESPQANTSTPHGKLPSSKATQEKTTKQEDDPRSKKTSLFYGEMSHQKGCNEGEKSSDKQLCQQAKTSRQDDSGTPVSKGLMVYANQVASDVMVSFLKTMKVEKKGNKHVPACLVLKKVVLKHTRDVISDLIDSTMKNLHSVTSVLMTDSDFVATVKKNLFNMGSQKSTEILEAMVRRLYNILLSEPEKSRSQSLAYTILKAGFPPDSKSQSMQFAAMKTQTQGKDKEKANPKIQTCAEKVSEHILKEGVTRLHAKSTCTAPDKAKGSQEKNPETTNNSTEFLAKDLILTSLTLIQQHLLQQATKQTGKDASESGATSLGYVSRDSHFEKAGTSQSSRSLAEASGSRPAGTRNDYQQQFNSQKGDISSVFLSIIQKVLCEAGLNTEDSSSDTNKSLKHIPASDCESGKQAIAKQPNSAVDQFDNMDQVNKQFIDQLVESAMKLCLLMVKGSGTDLAIGDSSEEPNAVGASSAKAQAQAMPRRASQSKQNGNPLTGPSSGSQVIVTNQNANSSSQNKELQAILQWAVASQFNVPNLSFMHGNEEDVKKLPLLAEKAAKKGYSVGDILQEVMRYYEKHQQFDTAEGNTTCSGLMDWMLKNL